MRDVTRGQFVRRRRMRRNYFQHLVVYVLSLADVNVRHYSLNPLLRAWRDDKMASPGLPINYHSNDKMPGRVCVRASKRGVAPFWLELCMCVHWLYICAIYKMIH